MATKLARALLTVLVGAMAATAAAQYGYQPFFDQPLIQNRAYGLELVLRRLAVIDQFEAPLDDDLMEQVEALLDSDVHRFVGTLRAADPALADDLMAALEEVEERAEAGEDASAAVAEARTLALRAYDRVVPTEVRRSPAFLGGVIADLSLGEGGVAEGYEEAAGGEPFEFTSGWASLQRVEELWTQLSAYATAEQRADVEEMLGLLDGVYPRPEPPAAIVGDPEEAEASVQRLISLLETVADAELFAGRDMPALAESLVVTLTPACRAYQAGDDAVALEGVFAVGELYVRYLADFMGFMAPEVHEEAAEVIGALTGLEAEGDEGEEGEEEDDEAGAEVAAAGAEAAPAGAAAGAACLELLEALEEAVGVLGG